MTEPTILLTDIGLAKLRAKVEAGDLDLLTRGEVRQVFAAIDYWRGQVEGLERVREAAIAFDAILCRYESDPHINQSVEYRRYMVSLEHLRAALAALTATKGATE